MKKRTKRYPNHSIVVLLLILLAGCINEVDDCRNESFIENQFFKFSRYKESSFSRSTDADVLVTNIIKRLKNKNNTDGFVSSFASIYGYPLWDDFGYFYYGENDEIYIVPVKNVSTPHEINTLWIFLVRGNKILHYKFNRWDTDGSFSATWTFDYFTISALGEIPKSGVRFSSLISRKYEEGLRCSESFIDIEIEGPNGEKEQGTFLQDKHCWTEENWVDEGFGGDIEGPGKGNYEDIPEDSGGGINHGEIPISKDGKELMNESKFVPFHRGDNCHEVAVQIMRNYGLTNFGSPNDAFRLVYEAGDKLRNWGQNPIQNYKNAIRCIDEHLNSNRVIMVGVNHDTGLNYNEGTTDHFIIVTGRGYSSSTQMYYYTFIDPATSDVSKACNPQINRLFYDETLPAFGGNTAAVQNKYYDVSQVRPNNGKSYKTEVIPNSPK